MIKKQILATQHRSIKSPILFTPVVFAVHNAEEYLTDLPAWSFRNTGMDLYKSSDVFLLAVCILSCLVALIGVAFYFRRTRLLLYVFSLVIAILGVNAVLHLISSIRYGAYTPGVATALLLILPLSVYYFYLAGKLNMLTKLKMGAVVFGGALAMGPFAYVALAASQYILQT